MAAGVVQVEVDLCVVRHPVILVADGLKTQQSISEATQQSPTRSAGGPWHDAAVHVSKMGLRTHGRGCERLRASAAAVEAQRRGLRVNDGAAGAGGVAAWAVVHGGTHDATTHISNPQYYIHHIVGVAADVLHLGVALLYLLSVVHLQPFVSDHQHVASRLNLHLSG